MMTKIDEDLSTIKRKGINPSKNVTELVRAINKIALQEKVKILRIRAASDRSVECSVTGLFSRLNHFLFRVESHLPRFEIKGIDLSIRNGQLILDLSGVYRPYE